MCANYLPSQQDRLNQYFGVTTPDQEFKPEIYPGYLAPVILPPFNNSISVPLQCILACFGMVPQWAGLKLCRKTYNARSETVASKPSFRHAWKQHQFCLIPLDAFFEPCYESGHPVRWRIEQANGEPLAVAGVWEKKANGPGGAPLFSFSMLTINADQHPLMQRFHPPGSEKRMPALLGPVSYHGWLHARPDHTSDFFLPYPASQLHARPDPKPLVDQRRPAG